MQILGIDYGTKRIGVAISDQNREFAMPLVVIPNSKEAINKVKKICKDNEISEIVIGESRNYKGEPNAIFDEVEIFKKELELKKFTVYLEPEFMTSVEAERIQGKNDMSDASAAALILQAYLDKTKDIK
ncbi:MAG: Holliday junction resolvase RuvX [Candidatus Paceibacterota bacterium]|jgi:putative Holliday junction resolvase